MDKIMKGVIYFLAIGALLYGVSSCVSWRFHECKQVGHGTAYCVWEASR